MESETSADRIARAAKIRDMPARKIALGDPMDKASADEYIRSLSTIVNAHDRCAAAIPVNTVGKLLGHRGFDFSRIIKELASLYEKSLWRWREKEIPRAGHKQHNNIKAYHHYINKFEDDRGDAYYIRFTVTEMVARPGKVGRNLIHSAAVSYVRAYKKGDLSQSHRVIDPGRESPSPFVDQKLKKFLETSNHNIGDSQGKVNTPSKNK